MAGAEDRKSGVTAAAPGPPPGQGEACWHALDGEAVLARLESGPALADEEHARRLALHGPNLPEGQRRREPRWEELAESVTQPLQPPLIAVAAPSAGFSPPRAPTPHP